jgi:C2 domain
MIDAERDVARLALHVIKGEGLWFASGRAVDSQVHVSVRDDDHLQFKTKSRVIHRDSSPQWQLTCVIDLAQQDPLRAAITIEVRHRRPPLRTGKAKRICAYYATLRDLLKQAPAAPEGPVRPQQSIARANARLGRTAVYVGVGHSWDRRAVLILCACVMAVHCIALHNRAARGI